MDAIGIIEQIYGVTKKIYDQVKLAEANKAQCQELGSRVQLIESTIRGLNMDATPNTEAYRATLKEMLKSLNESLEFIKNFADVHWFWKIVKAGTHEGDFAELFEKLYKAAQLLNLGLSAQQIMNQEATQKASQQDAQAIQASQAKITGLCKQNLAGINQIQEYQQLVLERQLRSIRLQFDKIALREQRAQSSAEQKSKAGLPIEEKYIIHSFDLAFDEQIDQGSFATVFAGRWEGQAVAIKFIEGSLSAEQKKQFIREVQIMNLLNNPAIPQFFGANLEAKQAYLVMEYMPLRSLSDYQQSHQLTPLEQHAVALQIANGLAYLHRQGIIHCDIKGRNLLLAKKDDRLMAKITDFGLSHLLQDKGIASIDEVSQAYAFSAPEMLQDASAITPAIDIFGFGSLLWQLLKGKEPFAGISNELLLPRLKKGEQEPLLGIPEQYAHIITACWQKDPARRLTAVELVKKLQQCTPSAEAVPLSPTPSKSSTITYLGDVKEAQGFVAEQKKEYVLARQCYEAAIASGSIKAKTKLATLLLTDQGGVPDKTRAATLFREAAEKGHDRAIYNLGIMYCNGEIPEGLVAQGIRLLNKAATRGHVQSMQTLAKIYETGQYGVTADPASAKKWRILATAGPKLITPSSPTQNKPSASAKTAVGLTQ